MNNTKLPVVALVLETAKNHFDLMQQLADYIRSLEEENTKLKSYIDAGRDDAR